jgi:mannosyltransferase
MALTRPWPIVLFHPGDYDHIDERNKFISNLLGVIGYETSALEFVLRVEFARLDWTLPKGISSNIDEVDPVYRDHWPGSSSSV